MFLVKRREYLVFMVQDWYILLPCKIIVCLSSLPHITSTLHFFDISHSSSLNYGYILSQRLDRNAQKYLLLDLLFYLEPDLF